MWPGPTSATETDMMPTDVMATDSRRMRGQRPFVFTDLKAGKGLEEIVAFIIREGMLEIPQAPA